MKHHPAHQYPLQVRWSEENNAFLGSVPGLLDECCHGDTPQEVMAQLTVIAEDVVEYMLKEGQALPEASGRMEDPEPAAIRAALGLSQVKFAKVLGISPKTLHKWEQHTSRPSGAARSLLQIAMKNPQALLSLV